MLPLLLALSLQAGPLADLRVGEEDGVARLVLVCTERCAASPSGEGPASFLVYGLREALEVDVPGPGAISRVRIAPEGEGSLLSIGTSGEPRAVRLSRCQADALCFDVEVGSASAGRPEPPTLAALARRLETLEVQGDAGRTLLEALEAEAGVTIDPEACEAAREDVANDPWALDAFRLHALCRAAEGAPGEADGLLARLQAYAPDPSLGRLRALLSRASLPRAGTGASGLR